MKNEELAVIYQTRKLLTYILLVTEKSPKKFRFTLVSKLQGYSIEAIENLVYANMVFVENKDHASYIKRNGYQKQALANLKLLVYIAEVAMETKCILHKQFEQISKQVYVCQNLLIAWIKSDKSRLQYVWG